ncbi:MAG: hypothetical protein MUF18_05495 [Fimbriiglobus sp.]|jgi:hypothetical protein|nr:hypothetical protein [Fimbriiglobus sp.]
MTLDDLKSAWVDLDRKLTATQVSVHQMRTAHALDRVQQSLRPLGWALGWELLQGLAAAVLLGVFLAAHASEAKFAIPGGVLYALAVLSIGLTVWQFTKLHSLDYTAPVVNVQIRLAELRRFRLRVALGVLFTSPLIWALGVIVIAKSVGVDLFAAVGWPWVMANFGFGVVFLIAAVILARTLGDRFRGSGWLARLADNLTGRSLARATAQVREAAEFAASP